MSKELETKKTSALSTHVNDQHDRTIPQDFLADYIVLCQGMSNWVKKREAVMGDIVKSTSGLKVGGIGAKSTDPTVAVETIFLGKPQAFWINEKLVNDKFVYDSIEPRTADNASLEWDYVKDGHIMRRVQSLKCFALLMQDILSSQENKRLVEAGELPDPTKALMPVVYSFRGFSYKAGREVSTFYDTCGDAGAPIYRYSLPVSCEFKENEKGAFYVYTVNRSKAKPVPKEFWPAIERWSAIANSGAIKADDASIVEETAEVVASPAHTERQVNKGKVDSGHKAQF